jgi:molybdate transport repressor ModE-like protein
MSARLRDVTLRQLRALAALAAGGSITAAAARLNLTQPAVTQQLRALQTLAGQPLLQRTSSGMLLTAAGQELLTLFERIEVATQACASSLEMIAGRTGGQVSIGAVSTAKYFVPFAIAAFSKLFPQVKVSLFIGNRQEICQSLRGYSLDLVIMGRPPQDIDIKHALIGDHPHVIIAPRGHPLAGRRRIATEDLAGETLLTREVGSGTRTLMEQLFDHARARPQIGVELNSNESIKQAVIAGRSSANGSWSGAATRCCYRRPRPCSTFSASRGSASCRRLPPPRTYRRLPWPPQMVSIAGKESKGGSIMRRALSFSLVAALGGALPAIADEAAGSDPLGTVVVTATRQQRDLGELAGNDSVIDLARIQATMPGRPSELLNQLAGVGIEQGGGEEEIAAIRSPNLNGGAGQGSVLLMEDGVPLRAAGFGNVNGLYEADVEQAGQVEVVRGPGSALYGSNAVHGLINVIPRAPADGVHESVDGLGGSFGTEQVMASISQGDGRDGVRLSAEDRHESGWRDDTRLDEQKFVLRDVWHGGDSSLTSTLSGQDLNQQTGAYILGKDAYLSFPLAKSNPIPTAYRRADSIRGMIRWQGALDPGLDLSITPYVRYTTMNFMMFYLPSQAIQANTHVSVGVQNALYKSIPGGHSIILGIDAEHTHGWYNEVQTKPTFRQGANVYPTGLHYDLAVDADVVAPYLHSEWQLLDHTRLTAGLRLEETDFDYSNLASSGIFGLYQRPPSRSDSFTTVTPKLGLVQQWLPGLDSYVSLSRGARAPQVTDLYELQSKQVVGQVKAETLDSAEIGSHLQLAGVHVEADGYWMNKNHYFYRAADGTNVPDGKTEHRGTELEVTAPLPYGFDLGSGASYALHTYAFNRPDSTLINTVVKGTSMPNAPRTLANLRLGYRWLAGSRAELEWVHVGAYFTDNANTHSYGGHELFNARLTTQLTDSVALQAKVTNLANRAYADRASVTTTGIDEYFPGAPRSYFAGIAATF